MNDTIARWLEGVQDFKTQYNLRKILMAIGDRYASQMLQSAGLVISAGGSTTAKTGSAAAVGIANGTLVSIGAGTAMPALVGSIAAGDFNVFAFFVDSAGNLTVAMGTQSATLAGVVFPVVPIGKAIVGFLIVTYASQFVGGTTPLDTATTTYVSPTGAFDPTVLTGSLTG